jgi:hypothetical protein
MHYTNAGLDAVRQLDEDPANGIPDLVENCAIWADRAWDVEVDSLGFPAPPLPSDGSYDMTFKRLGGTTLGVTIAQPGEGPDHTEIWLRRGFGGGDLIQTEDPDGNRVGRAKATVSHEFKHAIQYATSHWVEGSWVELDANWVIDAVFDETNAYIDFLNPDGVGSQLSNPEEPLDLGGAGSYQDLLWEQYLSEKHGHQIVVDFWGIRAADTAQAVLDSYQDAQVLYGASWSTSYPEFMEWCWFSGSLADPMYGFEEADRYRDIALREDPITTYPHAAADAVAHLACHHRRFEAGTPARAPRVTFDGDDAHPGFTVSVVVGRPDGSFTIVRPVLDASNDVDYLVADPWAALSYVGVTVTNSATSGSDPPYVLEVLEEAVTEVRPGPAHPSGVLAIHPNPFTASTGIRFTAPAPSAAGAVVLRDVAGRRVRTLHRGALPAGETALIWDGRGDDGRLLPAGMYWACVHTDDEVVARRLALVR